MESNFEQVTEGRHSETAAVTRESKGTALQTFAFEANAFSKPTEMLLSKMFYSGFQNDEEWAVFGLSGSELQLCFHPPGAIDHFELKRKRLCCKRVFGNGWNGASAYGTDLGAQCLSFQANLKWFCQRLEMLEDFFLNVDDWRFISWKLSVATDSLISSFEAEDLLQELRSEMSKQCWRGKRQ